MRTLTFDDIRRDVNMKNKDSVGDIFGKRLGEISEQDLVAAVMATKAEKTAGVTTPAGVYGGAELAAPTARIANTIPEIIRQDEEEY